MMRTTRVSGHGFPSLPPLHWRGSGTVLLLASLLMAAKWAGGAEEAYVLRLESPFVREQPQWLPLRIELTVQDGKPARAMATAIHLNQTWYPVEVGALRLAEGRFTGTVSVAFRADDYERAAIAATASNPDARRRGQDRYAGLPPQVITLDIPVSGLEQAAPGRATFETDVLNQRQKPVPIAARAWRPPPPARGAPLFAEFQMLRWDTVSTGSGLFDGQATGGALLLRCTIRDGQAGDWICLQGPERYSLQTADLIWRVEDAQVTLNGAAFAGTLNLVATSDEAIRKQVAGNSKYAKLPDGPVRVRLAAQVIGQALAGSAELAHPTPTTSAIIGVLRAQPFARHADRTPRTWSFTAEADPALVAAAAAEAAKPVRPGEPGKTFFWSESALYGGCDIFLHEGQKVVAYDRCQGKPWGFEPYADYRANTIAKLDRKAGISFIAPPSFNLPPVPGAARYRFSADGQTEEGSQRHLVPPALWQRLPAGKSFSQPLTIQALNAAGQPLGEPVKLPVSKRPSFQGPYFKKLPRSCREAALLSARWMRDNPANTAFRLNHGAISTNTDGDGQLWYPTYSGLYAGLTLAQVSPDPIERAAGLDLAVTVGEVWLRCFAGHYLPDTYKGWVFDQWVYGTAWLDLFRLTGDPRWREAALELGRRLAAKQLPSGTWAETDPGNGHVSLDAATGLPMIVSIQGPSMQQWDPSSTLYFLGRLRKELKTEECRAAEDKAWQWLQQNSIARFDWRKQGPHASEDHKQPWLTIPDCALHCYEYLALDLPGRTADPALMEDLLRWSEERNVDWSRTAHPTQVFPRILFLGKNRDTQLRLARAFARQAQRTGSALWKAKAEALAGAMLTAQFPTTGQIPHVPDVDATLRFYPGYCGPGSGDGGNRGEYATLALLDLAALWETQNERKNP
jgi:hypothetical protein